MPPSPLTPESTNKYPVQNVMAYMGKVVDAGFGRLVVLGKEANVNLPHSTNMHTMNLKLNKLTH